MENLFQYVFLFIGAAFFVWGSLIVGSDKFFIYWQNRYWQEKNNHHNSTRSVFYNRYVTGLSTLLLGIGIIYLMFTSL